MSKTPEQSYYESLYLVILQGCSHKPSWQRAHLPEAGDQTWCVPCGKMRVVSHVAGMYRCECTCRRFTRYFGAARLTAQRSADKHARKNPGHLVIVSLGGEFVSKHEHAAEATLAGNLDGTLDLPPF